jgi:hypothetical protein
VGATAQEQKRPENTCKKQEGVAALLLRPPRAEIPAPYFLALLLASPFLQQPPCLDAGADVAFEAAFIDPQHEPLDGLAAAACACIDPQQQDAPALPCWCSSPTTGCSGGIACENPETMSAGFGVSLDSAETPPTSAAVRSEAKRGKVRFVMTHSQRKPHSACKCRHSRERPAALPVSRHAEPPHEKTG